MGGTTLDLVLVVDLPAAALHLALEADLLVIRRKGADLAAVVEAGIERRNAALPPLERTLVKRVVVPPVSTTALANAGRRGSYYPAPSTTRYATRSPID